MRHNIILCLKIKSCQQYSIFYKFLCPSGFTLQNCLHNFAILQNHPINPEHWNGHLKTRRAVQQKHPQLLGIESLPVFEGRTDAGVIHLLPAELRDLY